MTKEEIYEQLAAVYLGKREIPQKRKQHNPTSLLISKILLAVLVLLSAFYSFTAFLSGRSNRSSLNNVIFALSNNLIRITYDFNDPYPQIKKFSLPLPKMDAGKYRFLSFSMRAEEGNPGIVKVVLTNKKQESASYFLKQVDSKWQVHNIPLSELTAISDWSNLTDISFVLEAWNVKGEKGTVLLEDVCFSNEGTAYGT